MQIIYPPSSGGYAATFPQGKAFGRMVSAPTQFCNASCGRPPHRYRTAFLCGARRPRRATAPRPKFVILRRSGRIRVPRLQTSPHPSWPTAMTPSPSGGKVLQTALSQTFPLAGEGGPQGRMRVRFESGLARLGSRAPRIKGRGMELRLTPKHLTCAAATGIPDSATTSRHPPTQAAKKCWIEPRLFPVPPAESTVDGAGALRGRKDGPPDSYLGPLNPHRSPFFFGFQKPFFFRQGKRNGL